MRIKPVLRCVMLMGVGAASIAQAGEGETHDHGGEIYHAIHLETQAGSERGDVRSAWDLDGWVGGDTDKLWLKSEGERTGGTTEQAELWALYSRNVTEFWDAQLGLRHDFQPHAHSYLTAGFTGLAPYFFETQAHLFVRDDGEVSARLREEYELLLTNRLILRPRLEANLSATNDHAEGIGSGLNDLQIGLQTRYEISRRIAPYVDVTYRRKFGTAADAARADGEHPGAVSFNTGIRWLF